MGWLQRTRVARGGMPCIAPELKSEHAEGSRCGLITGSVYLFAHSVTWPLGLVEELICWCAAGSRGLKRGLALR